MRPLASFIMTGRIHAAGVVLLLTLLSWLLPLVSLFAVAALALPTLRQGAKEGGIIALIALAGLVTFGGYLLGSPGNALVYGLILWGPAWFLAAVLRETGRLSWAVLTATALGGVAVLIAYGFLNDPATFWLESFKDIARPALEQAPSTTDVEELLGRFVQFAPYVTGVIALGSVLSLVLSLFLARWWQAQLYNPGGFGEEFKLLAMPKGLAYSIVGLILLATASSGVFSEVLWNLVQPCLAPFIFTGFALLHLRLGRQSFWLHGIYVLLLFVPYIVLPVMLLGFSDTLLGLRERIEKNRS